MKEDNSESIKEKLKASIIQKADAIKDKILLSKGSQDSDYLQILIMVDDELDDVLLNWESEALSAISFGDDDEDYNNTRGAKLVRRFFSVSDKYVGDKFFTIENGKKLATPLLVVVAVIEFTDLLFAVDSIPAIFAISNDPFILYSSNIFAILGLRALFFLLDNFIHLFSKLTYGLAFILSFIGIKMIISPFYHIESVYSLLFILCALVLSVIASIMFPNKDEELAE